MFLTIQLILLRKISAVDADKLFNLLQVLFTAVFGKYYCISKSLGMKSGNAKESYFNWYEGSQVPNQKKKNERGRKAKAESILAQVNANPDSFMMLAFTNSDDSSTKVAI
jgi:peptidyl-prolyl cis-trans isomerase D